MRPKLSIVKLLSYNKNIRMKKKALYSRSNQLLLDNQKFSRKVTITNDDFFD